MGTETKPKRKTSIMRRITLMSWLVAVVSVAVFALCMVRYQRQGIHSELQQRGRILAMNLEEEASNALLGNDFTAVLANCLRTLEKNPDVEFVGATTLAGNSLIQYRENGKLRFWGPGSLPHDEWSEISNNEKAEIRTPTVPGVDLREAMVFSKIVTADGAEAGRIHLGMSLASVEENVLGVYTATALVGTVTLIIGVLGSWLFARNITKPLHSLQSFAAKVATGALNARATVESGDEIGDLAESINRMVQSLEANEQKLRNTVKSEAAAREKEILLREIHHRVKNNMQILTSLLRLQGRRANSEEMRNVLLESEARIRSMGMLHEKLYQSESVSSIDMNGYLRSLTNELLRVNTPAGKRREVRLNINGIALGMDTALPCGLIVTELVSNSLKYAFPTQIEGVIYVSIELASSGEYALIVWDNGVGVPAGFDPAKAESLGMRLVTMLTDQLNGKCAFTAEQGTRWEIKFRESQYKVRV
jgi:two-component sensor histidine kinase